MYDDLGEDFEDDQDHLDVYFDDDDLDDPLGAHIDDFDVISDSPIATAIFKNDLNGVKELLDNGEDPNTVDHSGYTPLHLAIKNDLTEIFDYILSLDNIKLDAQDDDGLTPLMISITTVNSDHFVEKLLEKGANVNVRNFQGQTALHKAVRCAKVNLCEMLIRYGADVNICDNGRTCTLFEAFQIQSSECVHLLIYHNALVNWDLYWNELFLEAVSYCEQAEDDYGVLDYICDDLQTATIDLDLVNCLIYRQPDQILKLLERANEIVYEKIDLIRFGQFLFAMPTECLKLMIEKFEYVIDDFLSRYDLLQILLQDLENGPRLDSEGNAVAVAHLFLLVDKGFAPRMIENYQQTSTVLSFLKDLPLNSVTEIVMCLVSYGFQFTVVDVYTLYDMFGYCELFEFLLHMDFDQDLSVCNLSLQEQGSCVLTTLLCDMTMSIDKYVNLDVIDLYDDGLYDLLDHCAHPKLRKLAAESDCSYLIKREKLLPRVPLLVELARNASRQHIINFYKIEKSWQYYTVIKHLELPDVCVKLLSFQRKLYSVPLDYLSD